MKRAWAPSVERVVPGSPDPVGQRVVGHDPFDARDAVGGEVRGGAERTRRRCRPSRRGGSRRRRGGCGRRRRSGRSRSRPGGRRSAHGGGSGLVAVAAVDPPAAAVAEPAELLDVDVDQLAGPVAFVAADQLPVGRSSQASRCMP